MPDIVQLSQPRRMVFGNGCAARCAEEVAELGFKRVLIVTSRSVRASTEPLASLLRAAGATVETYSEAPPEPTFEHLTAALVPARAFGPDAVIGFGGGSALDLAKLLAALHAPGSPDTRAIVGVGLLARRTTFLACIPTTAGSGSEVSPNAVLLDADALLKRGIVSRWLVPDSAYIDPTLTVSMSPALTAATGVDALVHCIESFANRAAHPAVDVYALEGIRLIGTHLLHAVRDGSDLEARGAVARGSMCGGLCLGPVNTAAVHALAYPLGGEFHLAHGISNAVLLAPVLRFNLPAAPSRYAAIARALGAAPGASDTATAENGLALLEQLCAHCGIPAKLTAFGIPADAIPRMAKSALTVQRLLKNNPREVTLADAEAIYRSAY